MEKIARRLLLHKEFCEEQTGPISTRQRVGINTLKNVLPLLSKESGIGVRYTNHSLHATAYSLVQQWSRRKDHCRNFMP